MIVKRRVCLAVQCTPGNYLPLVIIQTYCNGFKPTVARLGYPPFTMPSISNFELPADPHGRTIKSKRAPIPYDMVWKAIPELLRDS